MTKTKSKPKTIIQAQAPEYILALKPFRASSLYAERVPSGIDEHFTYILYSYGPHWPLAIYKTFFQKWYVNMEDYSKTTTHHRNIFMKALNRFPIGTAAQYVSCSHLKDTRSQALDASH